MALIITVIVACICAIIVCSGDLMFEVTKLSIKFTFKALARSIANKSISALESIERSEERNIDRINTLLAEEYEKINPTFQDVPTPTQVERYDNNGKTFFEHAN